MTKRPPSLLKMWLGAMYQADVLKRGSYEDAKALVVRRLAADQDLRREAEEMRTALVPVVKARPHSHVEKATLKYLDEVLAKENTHG